MTDRFFSITIDIPQAEGIGDLFKGLMFCNTGAIVVAYKQPVIIDNVNVGDESIAFQNLNYGVAEGRMIALDVRRMRR